MGGGAKTLDEIRSAACNLILLTVTGLGIPAVGASLLRGFEQGWKPIMGVHIAMILLLIWTSLRRHHLSLVIRAIIVTMVPFIVAAGGLLTSGRGNGALMFFITSCVLAGCFFSRRVTLGVIALCVLTIMFVFIGHRLDLLALPLTATDYDMSVISWFALGTGFLAAVAAPIIGLSALLQSLDAERKRADEAAKVRSDFLAHMSHELRTPMAGLIGMAEALKGTTLDDQQKTLTSNLLRAGRNLLSVLNDLLDFSKFEAGSIPLENLPFSISETIKDTCATFAAAAAQKGVALVLDMPALRHDGAIGDSHRIAHVLANLIDNAIKFTARGTVTVRVGQTPRDGGFVLECTVIDTGIGLSPEQATQIFEPFTQADVSISRRYGGSGLGLAISRRLTDAMGGEISVASQPGHGAAFTVKFPLAAHDLEIAPVAASDDHASLPVPPRTGGALRLLVAEDNANMQMLVDIMLPRLGYAVTVVHDGAAAVAAASAETYDCIIMDMHMPVMNGPDAMRAIHNAEAAKGRRPTPMIALTADLILEHVRAFQDAGADAIVGKPVDWGVLDAKIRQLAGEHAVAADER